MTAEAIAVAQIVQASGPKVRKQGNGIWSSFATKEERQAYGRYLRSLHKPDNANKGGRPRNTPEQAARATAKTRRLKAKRYAKARSKTKAAKLKNYGRSRKTNPAYDIFPASVVEYVRGNALPLLCVRTETGCIVPLHHKTSSTGYVVTSNRRFRECGAASDGVNREALHRLSYRLHNNLLSIPEGYEIDHMCLNPPCCNPQHLQALRADEHAFLTQTNLHARKLERVRMHWLIMSRRLSARTIAAHLDMPLETVIAMLAMIDAEEHEDHVRWGLIAA